MIWSAGFLTEVILCSHRAKKDEITLQGILAFLFVFYLRLPPVLQM